MDTSNEENKDTQVMPVESVETKTVEPIPVAPTTTPEPLAPTQKPKSRMKIVLIILGVLVLLCAVGCGAFFGVTYYIGLQQTKNLKKVENDRLVFYYPENYNSEKADSGEFVYSNPDKNKFGGNSSIRTMDDESLVGYDKIDGKDSCKKFAEGNLESQSINEAQSDVTTPNAQDVVYTEFGKEKSCSFKMEYDAKDFGKDGKVIIRVKVIFNNSDKDAVVASYDDGTSSEEKDRLDRSVNLFGFKK